MNPERGPPFYSLLSRASIFLLFPSPLLLLTSLCLYECACVQPWTTCTCVSVRVYMCVYVCMYVIGVSCFRFLYTYSESRAVDLIRFLQTDKEQNFSSRIHLPTRQSVEPNTPWWTALFTTRLFFFFSEILRALATRRKTKAILWCNWNPKLSPIRTIKDKSMYLFYYDPSHSSFLLLIN